MKGETIMENNENMNNEIMMVDDYEECATNSSRGTDMLIGAAIGAVLTIGIGKLGKFVKKKYQERKESKNAPVEFVNYEEDVDVLD